MYGIAAVADPPVMVAGRCADTRARATERSVVAPRPMAPATARLPTSTSHSDRMSGEHALESASAVHRGKGCPSEGGLPLTCMSGR